MQKYDEDALCKAFAKIVDPIVQEIHKNTEKDIFSQIPKAASDRFFTNYTEYTKKKYTSNYIIANGIIDRIVYFFDFDIWEQGRNMDQAITKIEKLIKRSNIPFKYGVDVSIHDGIITLGIKISELLKLDPNIAKKSNVTKNDIRDIIFDIIRKNQNKLNKAINRIIKEKQANEFLSVSHFGSFNEDKNDLYICIVDIRLYPEELKEYMNDIQSIMPLIKSLLDNIIPFKYELIVHELYKYYNYICIHIDTSLQYNIDKTLSIINEAVQKYDDESLIKSAQKILGKYIKDIQSKIDEYLATQSSEIKHYIFKDYIANSEDWYEGYSIYRGTNKIGLYVYFYNPYDDYNNVCKEAIIKVKNIIKQAKLPIPFTVEYAGDEQIPIEICIKIDDLIKLDPSISRKTEISKSDACDIVEEMVSDKNIKRYILSNLRKIIKKYHIDDICTVSDLHINTTGYYGDKYSILITLMDYDPYSFSSRDTESDEFIKMMKSVFNDIGVILKQVIPFKLDIDIEWEEYIVASIKYDDIKNHKDALKYIHETATIFESIRFI